MTLDGSKVKLGLHREPKFSLDCPHMGHRSNQGCTGSLYYACNINMWIKGQARVAQGS